MIKGSTGKNQFESMHQKIQDVNKGEGKSQHVSDNLERYN